MLNATTSGLRTLASMLHLRKPLGVMFLLALCIPLALTLRANLAEWKSTGLLICLLLYIVSNLYVLLRGPGYPSYRQQGDRLMRATFFALSVLTIGMTLVGGNQWQLLFIFTSLCAAKAFDRQGAFIALGCIEVIILFLGVRSSASWQDLLQLELLVIGTGAIFMTYRRLATTIDELQVARQEIAQLAIADERLRFARDLHDLLGHSLSLIALKSEVASRMLDSDTQRVALEVRDIEQVARAALQEVRDAVAGYRNTSLATELAAAQTMLATAAIAFKVSTVGVPVPLAVAYESALALAVREGVTNVVRHSGARHCAITIHYAPDTVTATIQDDGKCPPSNFQPGNGLCGLQERLQALGGGIVARIETNAEVIAQGFCLMAQLPLAGGEDM